MGLFDKLDKLANAGARSSMPVERLTKHKGAAQTTNHHIQLSQVAVNLGASRVARKQAERQLIADVGKSEAERLMKQSAKKIRDSFNS